MIRWKKTKKLLFKFDICLSCLINQNGEKYDQTFLTKQYSVANFSNFKQVIESCLFMLIISTQTGSFFLFFLNFYLQKVDEQRLTIQTIIIDSWIID